jgi:hypothetical protein
MNKNATTQKASKKTSTRENPIAIPNDDSGNAAVYGLHKGQGIYGLIDWDQFFDTWDRVGKNRQKNRNAFPANIPPSYGLSLGS